MPFLTYLNLGLGELAYTKLTVELAGRTVKHPKRITKNVLVGIGKFVFPVDFVILDIPEDVNVPLILERPFFSTAHAKVDVFERKINIRVRDEKIIFKSVKPASSLIKRVHMLSLREIMDLDLEARLMGETLILNRSLAPLYGDYSELNNLNEPLELRRNQVDDLEPTIEECKVVNKPMIDIVKARSDFIGGLDDYLSECDFDRRIHIDCAYNLKFSCMIGFEYVHVNFLPILPINVMSEKFYNLIMKDKIKFKGRNKLGNFVNAHVFIENFYVITAFIVVEDMGPYLNEGMGHAIVGEAFCKASYVEAKRFDGIITIRDRNDSVTYQMVRSNLRFLHTAYPGPRWKEIDNLVVEDMGPYLNEGMGHAIVGEAFCKASYVEAKRFDGIITIRDRNDSVTYQMVRSNLRFLHTAYPGPRWKEIDNLGKTRLVRFGFSTQRLEQTATYSISTNS
nr:hypothetical protein [Tanacetum cinerariifolium]